MAKATTTKSVMLSVRVPHELHERILARCDGPPPATVGATVIRLIQAGLGDRPTQAVDKSARHPSGPVLADPVPREVSGDAVGFNLKGQTKGKGKR